MKFAQMSIDGQVSVGAFYNEGVKWNGFECPIFEIDAAIDWLEQTQISEKKHFEEGLSFEWNPVSKILTVWCAEHLWPEEYIATEIDGYEGWFVSLGSHNWCWQIAD